MVYAICANDTGRVQFRIDDDHGAERPRFKSQKPKYPH
jgi:hypothetical protein